MKFHFTWWFFYKCNVDIFCEILFYPVDYEYEIQYNNMFIKQKASHLGNFKTAFAFSQNWVYSTIF